MIAEFSDWYVANHRAVVRSRRRRRGLAAGAACFGVLILVLAASWTPKSSEVESVAAPAQDDAALGEFGEFPYDFQNVLGGTVWVPVEMAGFPELNNTLLDGGVSLSFHQSSEAGGLMEIDNGCTVIPSYTGWDGSTLSPRHPAEEFGEIPVGQTTGSCGLGRSYLPDLFAESVRLAFNGDNLVVTGIGDVRFFLGGGEAVLASEPTVTLQQVER